MTVASAIKIGRLSESQDFKTTVWEELGDISGIEVYFNQILVATYIRSEKTKGGIIRPGINVAEDAYQGKVGLVLKKGPTAFLSDNDTDFVGMDVNINDYVVYRVGDGWDVTINGVPCRMLTDKAIKMRISKPEIVF